MNFDKEASEISVIEQILNRLDACVYITDLVTDEILFINDKMKREFSIEGDVVGHRCWKMLQDGFTNRCEFCPKHRLADEMDASIVWEEHNTATNKFYRNTDRIIQWVDGRLAHMQHSVDINDMKQTADNLQKRLKQQHLMSAIAHRFAGAGDFEALAQTSLEEIGRFMNADVSYMVQDVPAEQSFKCTAIWSDNPVSIHEGTMLSYANQMETYNLVRTKRAEVASYLTDMDARAFVPTSTWGTIEQITVPLFVGDAFWGCLCITSRKRGTWDESASQLAILLGGVFAVTLERRETEQKLYSAEQRLRTVIDNMSHGIFWKDTEFRFLGGNSAMCNMLGVDSEQIVGMTEREILTEETAALIQAEDENMMRTGEPVNAERKSLFPNGKERWMHVTKSIVKDEAGNPTAIVGILEDVSERKENEMQLLRMSAVIENSPLYIAYVDREGRFSYVNPVTVDVTGYSPDELMSNGLQLLHDEATSRRIYDEILPEIRRQGKYSFELPLIRKDGQVRYMSFSGFLVDKDEQSYATIALDITRRRMLEQEVLREKETAVRANEAKTEFLSRMSHEIRTPMNAIIGMTDIARGAKDTDKIYNCLEKIDTASKHLLGIINDILDMAKIEAQRLDISPHEFQLERMVMDAMSVVTFLADEKQQTLMVRLDRTLPLMVNGDEMRLKQVITNLLSNAVKFTDRHGEIHLNVDLAGRVNDEVTILFEVRDSGVGMDEAQMARLFKPFEQGDGSITRRYGGTGLGLAICKELVELMGGEIRAESEPGKGSKFIFTVRVKILGGESANREKYKKARVLAVDDSPEIREYFAYVLEGFPITVDLAPNGEQAIDKVKKTYAKDEHYDAIFIDWDMPGINGVETAKHIRETIGSDSIIIMISSFKWDAIEHEARAVGINQFIPKPLFPSALLEAIYHQGNTRVVETVVSAKPQSLNGRNILLAEDVEVNREIVAALLENTGATLTFACTGNEAVEQFKTASKPYDLVLMDIHMPGMDGHEATRLIRAMDSGKRVPIIAMTADAFREDVEKCRRSGMNEHIAKPISKTDLYAALGRYLPAGGVKEEKSMSYNERSEQQDYSDYIDVDGGIARLLGNRKLYLKLLGGCRIAELDERLSQRVGDGDHEGVRQTAHELKGVAANLSLTMLAQLASEIEILAKNGESAAELLPAMSDAAEKTIAAIADLCGKEA